MYQSCFNLGSLYRQDLVRSWIDPCRWLQLLFLLPDFERSLLWVLVYLAVKQDFINRIWLTLKALNFGGVAHLKAEATNGFEVSLNYIVFLSQKEKKKQWNTAKKITRVFQKKLKKIQQGLLNELIKTFLNPGIWHIKT